MRAVGVADSSGSSLTACRCGDVPAPPGATGSCSQAPAVLVLYRMVLDGLDSDAPLHGRGRAACIMPQVTDAIGPRPSITGLQTHRVGVLQLINQSSAQ